MDDFKDHYLNVAHGLLPPGAKPSVVSLRKQIAAVIQREVEVALGAQKASIDRREVELQRQQQALTRLIHAFQRYFAWMNGDGETDENAARFRELVAAHEEYGRANGKGGP